MGHPDEGVRRESERWFKRCIDQTAYLGGDGYGVCFAIMTVKDNADSGRRKLIMDEALAAYGRLAEYAAEKNLKYLMFEPTSVERESCGTIAETAEMIEKCRDMAVPMKLCLNVRHRNVGTGNKDDGDPYAWLERFGKDSPTVHIQQTGPSGSNHWPFTEEHNKEGFIDPGRVVGALRKSGATEVLLAFELGVKAFYPHEQNFLSLYRESTATWKNVLEEIS